MNLSLMTQKASEKLEMLPDPSLSKSIITVKNHRYSQVYAHLVAHPSGWFGSFIIGGDVIVTYIHNKK